MINRLSLYACTIVLSLSCAMPVSAGSFVENSVPVQQVESCAICFDSKPAPSRNLTCNHAERFCTDCINRWLKINNSCPLCRQATPEQLSLFKRFMRPLWAIAHRLTPSDTEIANVEQMIIARSTQSLRQSEIIADLITIAPTILFLYQVLIQDEWAGAQLFACYGIPATAALKLGQRSLGFLLSGERLRMVFNAITEQATAASALFVLTAGAPICTLKLLAMMANAQETEITNIMALCLCTQIFFIQVIRCMLHSRRMVSHHMAELRNLAAANNQRIIIEQINENDEQ